MNRLFLLVLCFFISLETFSQEITVRFIGQLNDANYCRLDSVSVTNITRNWTETVEYPDTIIVLGSTVSSNQNVPVFQELRQNTPNPFDCETRVELSVSQREDVRMQLLDAYGKQYAEYKGSLDAGVHIFDISTVSPQTYVLNAIVNSRSYSIRMINVGSGCSSSIKYAGIAEGITAKLISNNEFLLGDNMRYVGYANIDGMTLTSEFVEQQQVVNQYITLPFTYYSCPMVETLSATDIATASATLRGNITNAGGLPITSRGFYYGTSADDISQVITVDVGIGEYAANLTGLSPTTMYFYYAFASNDMGISTGEIMSYTTNEISVPTLQTLEVSDVSADSATLNAIITDDGGTEIIARGFYWGTSVDNLTNNVVCDESENTFSANITGLTLLTTYYYCAYATNSTGTSVGEVLSFVACNCGGNNIVIDYDENIYETVLIGEQCWMKENLRTTHYADGTFIPLKTTTSSSNTAYRYLPDENENNVSIYGYLYNRPAAMHGESGSSANPSNVQGICPNGWHLPSDAEWTQLTDYLSSHSEYQCDDVTTKIAKSLASTTGWRSSTTTCAVGNIPENNNLTDFSVYPAGDYNGSYNDFGRSAYFWSATGLHDGASGYYRHLVFNNSNVSRYSYDNFFGISVRCIRD